MGTAEYRFTHGDGSCPGTRLPAAQKKRRMRVDNAAGPQEGKITMTFYSARIGMRRWVHDIMKNTLVQCLGVAKELGALSILLLIISGAVFAAPAPAAYTVSYKYDALNRLVEVRYSNNVVIKYAYDAAGNRILQEVVGTQKKKGQVTSS
jgi:YD repeat-containing protein